MVVGFAGATGALGAEATGAEATLTSDDAESLTSATVDFFSDAGFFAVEDDFGFAGFLAAGAFGFFLLFDMLQH